MSMFELKIEYSTTERKIFSSVENFVRILLLIVYILVVIEVALLMGHTCHSYIAVFADILYALIYFKFTCSGVDIDLMFSHEWDSPEGAGYTALYDKTCRLNNVRERQW